MNTAAFPFGFSLASLLTAYGVLILGAGLYGLSHPANVVLDELHIGIWWGALLLVVGLFYVWRFYPKKQ